MKKGDMDFSEKYVKWLSELNKKSGGVAGGKGANLAEMFNSGMPVPPAFVVTAQAFEAFIDQAKLKQQIKKIIDSTDIDNTAELEDNAAKVRELVKSAKMPDEMQKEIKEAYEILGTDQEIKTAMDTKSINQGALDILRNSKEPIFVAVRSSATTEDLSTASFAGQQDTYTNIKGNDQLIDAVKRCFASLYTARAVYYRHKKGFKEEEALLSVVVQKMINSDKSGVMFTKNPMNLQNEILIEAVFGLGEGIVSGKIRPDHYVINSDLTIEKKKIATKKIAIVRGSDGKEKVVPLKEEKANQQVLTESEIISLAHAGQKIEQHYKKPQDIEFAIENGEIYIVQSRPITTLGVEKKVSQIQGEVLLTGQAASPGVAAGKVRVITDIKDLRKIKEGDVLVTKMTNPDMVVTMQRSAAVVTDEGGATAHAAIVSREMGIPCIVGTDNATEVLKDGMMVTVDGSNGKVFEGAGNQKLGKPMKKEVLPVFKGTKTKIKVIVDLPDFAERAAKSEVDSVGLLRLEGIIAAGGKHPMYFVKEDKIEEYIELLKEGIGKIASHFKEVWIRSSDIRSDEYRNLLGAPQEVEVNPMLGMHGIRFSLKNKSIFEAEIEAIRRVAEKYPDRQFGIMFPQIISETEMKLAYDSFRKYQRDNMKIGAMIETPASVQIIRSICKYAKFISFGTNDLTQYTLAIDRGNADVQYLYNELHPSVLSQIKRVIKICREYNVESSICGQAGSRKKMVRNLVFFGINSISVNADMAKEISEYVAQLEKSKGKGGKKKMNDQVNPIDNLEEIEEKTKEIKEEVQEGKIEKQNEEDKRMGSTQIIKKEGEELKED